MSVFGKNRPFCDNVNDKGLLDIIFVLFQSLIQRIASSTDKFDLHR